MIEQETATEVAPATDPAAEIAQIERVMGEEPHRYWSSGEEGSALRGRYLNLLAAREAQPKPEPPPAAPGVVLPSLGEALGNGVDGDTYMARHRLATDVLIGLDPGDGVALADAFDALPGDLGVFALDVLAAAGQVFASPAAPEHIADFAEDDVGGELVRAWGDDAPAKVGMIHARIARILTRLPESQWDRVTGFIWSLPPKPRAAVLRRLAE